jgi:hypothetical protein
MTAPKLRAERRSMEIGRLEHWQPLRKIADDQDLVVVQVSARNHNVIRVDRSSTGVTLMNFFGRRHHTYLTGKVVFGPASLGHCEKFIEEHTEPVPPHLLPPVLSPATPEEPTLFPVASYLNVAILATIDPEQDNRYFTRKLRERRFIDYGFPTQRLAKDYIDRLRKRAKYASYVQACEMLAVPDIAAIRRNPLVFRWDEETGSFVRAPR